MVVIGSVCHRGQNRLLAEIPLGHSGWSEEIADLVALLASPDTSYITAQVIAADGGLT